MSPTLTRDSRFQRNKISPRWKAGSIDPESTTTIGEGELATMERPL